nr:hypothetical protein [Bacillus sp. 71mf]
MFRFVGVITLYDYSLLPSRHLTKFLRQLVVVGDVNRQGSIVLAATPTMETYIRCSNYITKLALQ